MAACVPLVQIRRVAEVVLGNHKALQRSVVTCRIITKKTSLSGSWLSIRTVIVDLQLGITSGMKGTSPTTQP